MRFTAWFSYPTAIGGDDRQQNGRAIIPIAGLSIILQNPEMAGRMY
jgi:hypothetical protein